MTSLRLSLLFPMGALLLLVGIISAVTTYVYVREESQLTFDTEIRQLATYVDALNPSSDAVKLPAPPPGIEDMFLLQYWDETGKLNWSSGGPNDAARPTEPGFSNTQISQLHWRSYTLITPKHTIRASLPLDESNEQASAAALQIAIPIAIVIPLSWLVLSFMIDRMMRSLDRTAWLIRNRKPDDPAMVSDEKLPLEIKPFVTSMNQLIGRLNENVEKQKRFVSDAAHELRTPLTAIGIQVNNLENALTTKPQRERIGPLKEGVKRANQLVERLLRLARAERKIADEELSPVPIQTVIKALRLAFGPIAGERDVAMSYSSEGTFSLDQRDAVLVLSALLENAIAYSPRGGSVALTAGQDEIAVLDEGPGIPGEKLPYIFERFYRATNTPVPGTGLGLSIAKAICDHRGWNLQIENRIERSGIRAVLRMKST